MSVERWEDVEGYEGLYQVSSLGRVKSLDRWLGLPGGARKLAGKLLKPDTTLHGYKRVELNNCGNPKKYAVHRLVAQAFLPRRIATDNVVNHLDFNPSNNNCSNLEWTTHKGNTAHTSEAGRLNPIENPNIAKKLDIDKVREIRQRYSLGETQVQLAAFFGVCQPAISAICLGHTWHDGLGRKVVTAVRESRGVKASRDSEVVKKTLEGAKAKELVLEYGLSLSRISAIRNAAGVHLSNSGAITSKPKDIA